MAEQPHITAEDLRTALGAGAGKGARRSRSVLPGVPEPPGWTGTRGAPRRSPPSTRRSPASATRSSACTATATISRRDALELRGALAELARAPFGRRRGVVAALRESGLLE